MTQKTHKDRGFTLIELMITVAIVGFLAAIAYPAYTNQIAKGRRAECRSGLMQALQQQERYYTQYNSYVTQTFSATASNPVIRQFSGDSSTSSACTLRSGACTSGTLVECVLVEGALTKTDPAGISHLRLDSSGSKSCRLNSSTSITTGNKDCWP